MIPSFLRSRSACFIVSMATFAASSACSGDSDSNGNGAGDGGDCAIGSCVVGFFLDESECQCVAENATGGQGGNVGGSGGSGNSSGTGGSGGTGCGLATCSPGYVLDSNACACVVGTVVTPLPTRGTWTVANRTGAPSPRIRHTIVWTGSEYAVWGGTETSGLTPFGDGALFNPATDAWRPMSMTGAPSPRSGHKSVWTGKYVAIVGQETDYFPIQPLDGALYDPATDMWKPIATTGAPASRVGYDVIAVDGKVVVWGGYSQPGADMTEFPDTTGGVYDPETDMWTAINSTNAPAYDGGSTMLPLTGSFLAYGSLAHFLAPDAGHTLLASYDLVSTTWLTLGERTGESGSNAHDTSAVVGSQLLVIGSTPDAQRCMLEQFDLTASAWTDVTIAESSGSGLECPRVSRESLLVAAGTLVVVEPMRVVDLTTYEITALADMPYSEVAETAPPSAVTVDGWQFHASATDGAGVFVFGGTVSGTEMFNCPPGAPCAAPQQYESGAYGALFTP